MGKRALQYSSIALGLTGVLVILLVLTACIPQSAIYEKSKASAAFYEAQHALSHHLLEGQKSTKIDDYADLILLNLAYQLESEQPFASSFLMNYYDDPMSDVIASYETAVLEGKKGNLSYTRYWHGSLIFLKPLLMFVDIKGIKYINAIVLIGLVVLLSRLLIKKKVGKWALALLVGLGVTSSYTVPFCLEYMPIFVVMLVGAIGVTWLYDKGEVALGGCFLSLGIMTCFFDFLTTETLSFTVPMVLAIYLLRQKKQEGDYKEEFKLTIKCGVLWGLGYVYMWLAKWSLASFILKTNVFDNALFSAGRRISRGGIGQSLLEGLKGILQNVCYLFPFNLATTYGELVLLVLGIGFIAFCLIFLYGQRGKKNQGTTLLVSIALVPYVRYLCISNHSYEHSFFTYRAQLVTVMVAIYILLNKLDWKQRTKRFLN